jgi:hypothetical protein
MYKQKQIVIYMILYMYIIWDGGGAKKYTNRNTCAYSNPVIAE